MPNEPQPLYSLPDLASSQKTGQRGRAGRILVYPLPTGGTPSSFLPPKVGEAEIVATVDPAGAYRYWMWMGTGWTEIGAGGGGSHEVLSATHTDSFAGDTEADLDLMTWIAASSRWEARPASDHGTHGGAAHALLDGGAVHTDTAADAPTRGSLIAGNATSAWDELPLVGANEMYLRANGSDPGWSGIPAEDILGQGAPYIGNPRHEISPLTLTADFKFVCGPYYPKVDTKIKSGWMAVRRTSIGTSNARMVIYTGASISTATLEAESNEVGISNTSFAWKEFTFPTINTLVVDVPYWIGIHSSASDLRAEFSSDTSGLATSVGMTLEYNSDVYAGGAAATFGAATSETRLLTAYLEGTAGESDGHPRLHTITGVNDHIGGNWKVIYTNGSGAVTELALGTSGQVLTSNGASSAPSFQTPAAGGGGDESLIFIAMVMG